MTLIGFQRLGENDDPDSSWIIPSSLSADQLKQSLDLIKKFEFSPPVFDDGREAGDFIRRKSAGANSSRRKAVFDDEDDGIDDDHDDEDLMFPAGGPTAMKKSEALAALKKIRRRRKEGSEEEDRGLTDEQLKARADARRERELEKNRKIKSELYVRDSDEESDAERDKIFFEQEEKLRQRSKITIMKELLGIGKLKDMSAETKTRKRLSSAVTSGSDDDDALASRSRKRQSSAISIDSDDDVAEPHRRSSSTARHNASDESMEEEATDTPMSSPHIRSSQSKRRKLSSEDEESTSETVKDSLKNATSMQVDEDETDEDVPVARPARQRVRAGFIIDSSDEE
jgi:replication fork protection complex subunit Tof1/Swi1